MSNSTINSVSVEIPGVSFTTYINLSLKQEDGIEQLAIKIYQGTDCSTGMEENLGMEERIKVKTLEKHAFITKEVFARSTDVFNKEPIKLLPGDHVLVLGRHEDWGVFCELLSYQPDSGTILLRGRMWVPEYKFNLSAVSPTEYAAKLKKEKDEEENARANLKEWHYKCESNTHQSKAWDGPVSHLLTSSPPF